jgi:hypothetical protein
MLIARPYEQETDITSTKREIHDIQVDFLLLNRLNLHKAFKVIPSHKEGTDRSML